MCVTEGNVELVMYGGMFKDERETKRGGERVKTKQTDERERERERFLCITSSHSKLANVVICSPW